MIAAAGWLPVRMKILQQLVIERQNPPAVERGFERLRITLAGDVLEKLVDGVSPLEHRVVGFARADQMRQRELLARQIKLNGMAEGDFVRIILPACPPFEEELALLADDEEFWRLPRAARVIDDGVDDADVEVREDDREFLGEKRLALPSLARLPGSGGACRAGRCASVHEAIHSKPPGQKPARPPPPPLAEAAAGSGTVP